jgi:hypothetical protein
LRHRKNGMIASKCSRQCKHRRNDGTQDQRPGHGERDLSDRQRQATGGDGNKRRAEYTCAAVEGPMPALIATKTATQYRQREDQPAEQANTYGVEDKPKGEDGGGSVCKDVTVAPSTTTAAQFRT